MKASERIRLAVESDIRNGVLVPGDSIDEQELAERYQVSRTPVREALLQLKVQGMLDSRPRNGMVVARMDVQELLAIWELMAEMESVCARLACQRMSKEERDELAQIHRQAESAADADDMNAWREANHAFHEALYKGCRNPYLRDQLLSLRARTSAYLRHAFSAVGRVRSSYEQHSQLVDAFLANDPDRAEKMMKRHMDLAQGAKGLSDLLINLPKSMIKN
jgi:DNA-binding GntR family transcriptional regulator